MFTKVFLICAFAFVASAYHIPYQGLEVPSYEKSQLGSYPPFLDQIKPVVDSPYYPGYYKYPYYTPEVDSVTPEREYPYYPQYVSSWLKYPYYARFGKQSYSPISSYYEGQQDIPFYYKYPGYGYQGSYPYSYGSYPFLSGYGSKYTGVPEYMGY